MPCASWITKTPWPRWRRLRRRPRRPGVTAVISALEDHDLQVFAGNDHGSVLRAVHRCDQRQQILPQRLLVRFVERRKRLEHWTVVAFEDVQKMLRRPVSEHEVAPFGFDGGS